MNTRKLHHGAKNIINMKRKTSTLIHLILFLNVIIFCYGCEETFEKKAELKGEWSFSGGRFTFYNPPRLNIGFFDPVISDTLTFGKSSYKLSYDISLRYDTIDVTCVRNETGKYSFTDIYHKSEYLFQASYWTGTITFEPDIDSTWTAEYELNAYLTIDIMEKEGNLSMSWSRHN